MNMKCDWREKLLSEFTSNKNGNDDNYNNDDNCKKENVSNAI